MRRVAPLVLLAACSTTPRPAVGNIATGPDEPVTVLLLSNADDTAFLVACARGGVVIGDLPTCLGLLEEGAVAGDNLGRRFPLGAPRALRCNLTQSGYGASFPAQPLPGGYTEQYPVDLRSQLLAWPAERIVDLVPAGDPAGAVGAALDQAEAAALIGVAPVQVVSAMRADLDGDDRPDDIWVVDGVTSDDLGPRAVIASLSTARGPAVVHDTLRPIELLGAIDLDGDGRDELIHLDHYSLAIVVSRLVGGSLVASSFGGC